MNTDIKMIIIINSESKGYWEKNGSKRERIKEKHITSTCKTIFVREFILNSKWSLYDI